MPWLAIAGWVFKALGFSSWAEKCYARHEAQVRVDKAAAETRQRAEDVANIPKTAQERIDAANKGDL